MLMSSRPGETKWRLGAWGVITHDIPSAAGEGGQRNVRGSGPTYERTGTRLALSTTFISVIEPLLRPSYRGESRRDDFTRELNRPDGS